jgi:leucyl aminopeptidase
MISALKESSPRAVPIHVVAVDDYEKWCAEQLAAAVAWLKDIDFKPKPGAHQVLPGEDGAVASVLLCTGKRDSLWNWADLAALLPRGDYSIATPLSQSAVTTAAIGWALGTYDFSSFRSKPRRTEYPSLVLPSGANRLAIEAAVEAEFLGRDLVNRPANDLGPVELVAEARKLAAKHGADCKVISGDDLLRENFPAVHTVGQGSPRTPALIDIRWGRAEDPKVTLVGKGVCFDTGGLTIKTEAWMRNMKKDMGGAAVVLAVAHMIMKHRLPVQLRVIVPTVENVTSGTAYRPGDIVKTRKGLTIEVANCDAEGRVILADALAAADEEEPELLIDVATLTGAARAALGPEIAAYFCDDDDFSRSLEDASRLAEDPLWRLPLWANYRKRIESSVGDILNLAPNDTAGAITAALLLKDFVTRAKLWVHLDVFGWNDTASPGRPVGGEPTALRALFTLIQSRYPAKA